MSARARRFPKPTKRTKEPRPIPKGKPPRGKAIDRHGDYRQRVKYANELWRHLIYAKEPSGACPRCFKRKFTVAAHCFIKGRYAHIRFDLSNGAPVCNTCHTIIDSDHLAKEEFFRRYAGDAEYDRLHLAAMGSGKMDMLLVILMLEQETAKRNA